MVFPPKKPPPNAEGEVICKSSETRPLSLKNTSNKIISGVNNRAILPCVSAQIAKQQRGVVPERNFALNVLEIDVVGRALSNVAQYATHRFVGL